MCLSILQQDRGWRPSLTIKDVLIGVQTLMNEPNDHHIAQAEAQQLCRYNQPAYLYVSIKSGLIFVADRCTASGFGPRLRP